MRRGGDYRSVVRPAGAGRYAACALGHGVGGSGWQCAGDTTAAEAFATRRNRSPGAAILLGGTTGNSRALTAAGRLAAAGLRVFSERSIPRIREGRGGFQPQAVPYFPEPAIALFAELRSLILVEAQEPISFFGY